MAAASRTTLRRSSTELHTTVLYLDGSFVESSRSRFISFLERHTTKANADTFKRRLLRFHK